MIVPVSLPASKQAALCGSGRIFGHGESKLALGHMDQPSVVNHHAEGSNQAFVCAVQAEIKEPKNINLSVDISVQPVI